MGVIADDGLKLPAVTVTRMEFGAGTPYHTVLKRTRPEPKRVFPTQIAAVVKHALAAVVEEGTARRLRGAFALGDGTTLAIGGKTGTGDDRFEVYSARGQVIESRVMNRTATFAFYLGPRFFGVMTVFVPGEAAANYKFTSAVAVQIIKDMEPALRPLVLGSAGPEKSWVELAKAFDAEAGVPDRAPKALPSVAEKPAPTPAPAPVVKKPQEKTTKKPLAAKPKSTPKPVPPSEEEEEDEEEPPQAPPPPQIDKPEPRPPQPPAKPRRTTWQEGEHPLF